jgi:hypothetical protein
MSKPAKPAAKPAATPTLPTPAAAVAASEATTSATVSGEEIVRVYHAGNHKGSLIHGEHVLQPGGYCDVPKSVADLWLEHKRTDGAPLATLRVEAPLPGQNKEVAALKDQLSELEQRLKGMEELVAKAKAAGLVE